MVLPPRAPPRAAVLQLREVGFQAVVRARHVVHAQVEARAGRRVLDVSAGGRQAQPAVDQGVVEVVALGGEMLEGKVVLGLTSSSVLLHCLHECTRNAS